MQEVVLLVDDDRYILHGLARALRHQPYQLYTATSGTEAQWILKSRNVDVIVADQQMPGMSGTDLLTWIAENYPEVTRIMLTGCPDLRTAMRAINQGAVFHFLTKPCNPAILAVTIRKALERKALLLENRRLLDVNGRQMQRLESYRRDPMAHDARCPRHPNAASDDARFLPVAGGTVPRCLRPQDAHLDRQCAGQHWPCPKPAGQSAGALPSPRAGGRHGSIHSGWKWCRRIGLRPRVCAQVTY